MSNSNEEVSPPSMVAGGFMQQQSAPDVPRSAPLPGPVAQQLQQPQSGGMSGVDMSLLRMLMQPAPVMPMSNGQVYAGAAYGGVHPGQANPILQGNAAVNEQARQQTEEQRRQVGLIQKVREEQQKRADAQDEATLKVLDEIKGSKEPRAQEAYGQGMAAWARKRGVDASPAWFVQSNGFSKEDLTDINNLVVANVPDAEITARYPSATTAWLKTQRDVLKNPSARRKLGYEPDDDPITAIQKKDADRAQNWIKAHPDFKEGGDLFAEANARFRKATGREITTSTKDDAALVAQVSQDARKALDDREEARKKAERDQKRADVLADRVQRGEDRPIPVPAGAQVYDRKNKEFYSYGVVGVGDMKADPSRYKVIGHTEMQLLEFMDTTGPQLDLLSQAAKDLLAVAPGANLVRELELGAKGKLGASPRLVEYKQAIADLKLEMARALSGGGQLRVTVLKVLGEDVVPSTSDTVQTALAKLNLSRRTLENRRKGVLGEKMSPLTPGTEEAPKPQGTSDVSGYKEGQRLQGSDGKFYRIKGGKPVPE